MGYPAQPGSSALVVEASVNDFLASIKAFWCYVVAQMFFTTGFINRQLSRLEAVVGTTLATA